MTNLKILIIMSTWKNGVNLIGTASNRRFAEIRNMVSFHIQVTDKNYNLIVECKCFDKGLTKKILELENFAGSDIAISGELRVPRSFNDNSIQGVYIIVDDFFRIKEPSKQTPSVP